jgi:hypothetical protein
MEPCTIRSTTNPLLTRRGWKPRKYLLLPVEGEKCPLTSPLIDRDVSSIDKGNFSRDDSSRPASNKMAISSQFPLVERSNPLKVGSAPAQWRVAERGFGA